MNHSLANPPIEKIEQCTKAVEDEFNDFDVRIKKLILVHDFTFEKNGFESKALFFAVLIFTVGIFVFMGWFYSVDIAIRASVASWAAVGLFLVFGAVIVAVLGFVRSVKSFSAYLLRRSLQRLTKKIMRQTRNIENFIKTSPITIDGIRLTKNNEILKALEKISDGFREIDDLSSYYSRTPPIPILSICSLTVAVLAIPSVYQAISSISDPQTIISYLLALFIIGFFAAISGVIYYFICDSRKESIHNIFGLEGSEQKLVNSLEQLNKLIVGDDLTKLFSDSLLIFYNTET
jgi:hypothetical protein